MGVLGFQRPLGCSEALSPQSGLSRWSSLSSAPFQSSCCFPSSLEPTECEERALLAGDT